MYAYFCERFDKFIVFACVSFVLLVAFRFLPFVCDDASVEVIVVPVLDIADYALFTNLQWGVRLSDSCPPR